ncbi:DUF2390 domain-containing protein [Alteromonadaceae bacterium BrNp21-10]|nr:DUF2390 domain-containing protein [Alteromonadaceae bacterium BrNp21-10]
MWQADAFWVFSCEYYAQRKQQFLQLQNQHGLNVNLLLLAVYLDTQNVMLAAEHWQKLINVVLPSDKQLQQVRLRRQSLDKSGDMYTQQLAQELALEQQQQACCIALLNQLPNIQQGALQKPNNVAKYISLVIPRSDAGSLALPISQ